MSHRVFNEFKGVSEEEVIARRKLLRDQRSAGEKLKDGLLKKTSVLTFIFMMSVIVTIFPFFLIPFMLTMYLLYRSIMKKQERSSLPARMPKSCNKPDPSNPIPGTKDKKFFKAQGIFRVGNDAKTDQEIWLSPTEVLTHTLIFGTTGAGKTETLVSLSFNAIALGSGMFYVDPKAAPKLAFQIYVMARLLGREHDILVVNYSVKSKPKYKYNPKKITNTTNPFAYGGAESLSEVLTALISTSDGDNAVFSNNAQTMMKSLMYGLVDKRDAKELVLSIKSIREHTALEKYIELACDPSIKETSSSAMKSYLNGIGWKEGMPPSKLADISRQHGFSLSYFSLPLANLTDTYGHIYLKGKGELDNEDVIKQRRIAIALLPSLEMSPPQLKSVGQITLSSLRNATSIGLGDSLEGSVDTVLNALPTNSPIPDMILPFLSITDEYAAIPTEGYAEVLTQGRGLGIAAIVASQDFAGIKGADEKGAKQIVANTKFKMIMAMDDPEDTWQLVKNIAGTEDVAETTGFDAKDSWLGYQDEGRINVKEKERVSLRDLQAQIEGEFHGFFKGRLIRGQTFYADPPLPNDMVFKINHKIGIEDIDKQEIERRYGRIKLMSDTMAKMVKTGVSKQKVLDLIDLSDKQIKLLKGLMKGFNENLLTNPNDRAISALMLAGKLSKDEESPAQKLINTQKNQKQQEEPCSSKSEEVKKDASNIEEDDDLAELGLPFGGLPSLGDEEDESTDEKKEKTIKIIQDDNKLSRRRRIQKEMFNSMVKGAEILKEEDRKKEVIRDMQEMEKAVNPDANIQKVEDSVRKTLSTKNHYDKPLPEKSKKEGEVVSDVQKLLNIVQNKKGQ